MQMSRSLFILVAVALCAYAQEEDEQDFPTVSGWDAFIRDKTGTCNKMAQLASTTEVYCQLFEMCCSMGFDPMNGDRCQTMERTCQGPDLATCVWKNCTELITTTTTTPAPTTPLSLNSAGVLAGLTSLAVAVLLC